MVKLVDPLLHEIDKKEQGSGVEQNKKTEEKYEILPDDKPALKKQKKFLQKVKGRCEDIISKAMDKCREVFQNQYKTCLSKVLWPVAWMFCWPLDLKFMCSVASDMHFLSSCEAHNQVDPKMGEYFERLSQLNKSYPDDSKVQTHFTLKPPLDNSVLHNTREGLELVGRELKEKINIFMAFIKIIDIYLAILCIRLMLATQKYNDDYLIRIDFDNVYITKYFIKIDNKRKKEEKLYLLPLNKLERIDYMTEYSLHLKSSEYSLIAQQLLRLVIEMITATVFVMFDYIFSEALLVVRKHADMTIEEHGSHNITLEIKGSGFTAKFFRSVIRSFNVSREITLVKSNTECLPTAGLVDKLFLYKIYLGYLLLVVLIIFDLHISRQRSKICSFFYSKQEKRRIIFIYNQALRKRHMYIKKVKALIQTAVTETLLREKYKPEIFAKNTIEKVFRWLKIFPPNKKCQLCGDSEPQIVFLPCHKAASFYVCPKCKFTYCMECWKEVGKFCYACALYTKA